MKTYKYKNEIIRETELEEIQLPKVGDRFRFTETYGSWEIGDEIKLVSICENGIMVGEHDGGLYDTILTTDRIFKGVLEPIPSPPVCPPKLLPLPEGAVYCGQVPEGEPLYVWNGFVWMESKWKNPILHYATTAGDACHRSQPWFSEDQVPVIENKCVECEELISDEGDGHNSRCGRFRKPPESLESSIYPPPESEWPEKPAPPEGCEWVRQGHTGINKTGDISLMSNMKSQLEWETSEFDGTDWFGTVVFRAVPIDYTEGGKYRMLEVGKDVLQEGDEVRDEPWGTVAKRFWGDKVMVDDAFRRPVKSDLQQKLAQLKILVDEIGKLNKSEA